MWAGEYAHTDLVPCGGPSYASKVFYMCLYLFVCVCFCVAAVCKCRPVSAQLACGVQPISAPQPGAFVAQPNLAQQFHAQPNLAQQFFSPPPPAKMPAFADGKKVGR